MKKIRNNKKVKPKWMDGEIKDLFEKPKWHIRLKKHSSEENQQRYRPLLQSKEGEIRKSKRLWGIELANFFR